MGRKKGRTRSHAMGAHGTMRTANQRCWGFRSRRRVCELPANLVRTSAPQSIARGEGTRAATSQAARRGTKAKTRRETKLRAGLQIKSIGNQAIRAISKRARTANRGLRNRVKRTPIPELSVERCCAVAPRIGERRGRTRVIRWTLASGWGALRKPTAFRIAIASIHSLRSQALQP